MLESIIEYFSKDPMKILYLLGGSGGLYFWYEKWISRVRIELEITRETYEPQSNDTTVTINFTCRNLGKTKSSMQKQFEVVSYMSNKKAEKFILNISGNDLELPPHEIKEFQAQANLSSSYCFSLFRAYTVKTTVGSNSTFYSYRTYKEKCCRLKREWSAFIFRYFNVSPRTIKQIV